MTKPSAGRDADPVEELFDQTWSRCAEGVTATHVQGLRVHKFTRATDLEYMIREPSVTLILAGSEHVVLGAGELCVRRGEFFIDPFVIPAVGHCRPENETGRFLGLVIPIDRADVANIMAQLPHDDEVLAPSARSASLDSLVGELTTPIVASMARMVSLLDSAVDAAVLGPYAVQEVLYRLLRSDQGYRLGVMLSETHEHRPVMQAVRWLRDNVASTVSVEQLAAQVAISPSVFYRQFRELTGMSPLQYRNRLRLGEARRLMITEDIGVSVAARSVGYRSISQFVRDYRRFFGTSPYQHTLQTLRH